MKRCSKYVLKCIVYYLGCPLDIARFSWTCKEYYVLLKKHPLVLKYCGRSHIYRISDAVLSDKPSLLGVNEDWDLVLYAAAVYLNLKYVKFACDNGACLIHRAIQGVRRNPDQGQRSTELIMFLLQKIDGE